MTAVVLNRVLFSNLYRDALLLLFLGVPRERERSPVAAAASLRARNDSGLRSFSTDHWKSPWSVTPTEKSWRSSSDQTRPPTATPWPLARGPAPPRCFGAGADLNGNRVSVSVPSRSPEASRRPLLDAIRGLDRQCVVCVSARANAIRTCAGGHGEHVVDAVATKARHERAKGR